jgi:hypothetical protein
MNPFHDPFQCKFPKFNFNIISHLFLGIPSCLFFSVCLTKPFLLSLSHSRPSPPTQSLSNTAIQQTADTATQFLSKRSFQTVPTLRSSSNHTTAVTAGGQGYLYDETQGSVTQRYLTLLAATKIRNS